MVFPGEKVNLHIFEPRYKQLLKECLSESKPFGICTYLDNTVMEIGTMVQITKINTPLPNGNIDIQITGLKRFKIKNYYNNAEGKLYPAADIITLEEDSSIHEQHSDLLETKIKELLRLNYLYFEIPKKNGSIYSFDISHIIGLSLVDKYELLKEKSETQRKLKIIKKLDVIIETLSNIEAARDRLRYNGTYKIIVNPEESPDGDF